MSVNENSYDVDRHIAESYDSWETQTGDVELIRRLIDGRGPLRILEPLCGTGRILIPLAQDGHTMVGLDQSSTMLDWARRKVASLPQAVQGRIELHRGDVTVGDWPDGFDLVLLGGNCFYELANPEEQEDCISRAAAALRTGGYVFVDNDHMEGPLPDNWTRPGLHKTRWPAGRLGDGTTVEGYTENLDCDAGSRIWRARRTILVRHPDGRTDTHTHLQQKHPVSFGEVADWLTTHGFAIEHTLGDPAGNPYTVDSPRATFWGRKGKE